MNYISTRGNSSKVSAAKAIKQGMVPEGGLYVPESFPSIDIESMKGKSYKEVAKAILTLYLTDFSEKEIDHCIDGAYNSENFDVENMIELKKLNDNQSVMELWHGPTAAFKDMALQIMPYFLRVSKEKLNDDKKTLILVATSGDTGKAALEGFKDIDGIEIAVFFPDGGVSEVQRLQMVTTDAKNTFVTALNGNFDDCQTGVKEIFSNSELKKELEDNGYEFSSANSINWGRLLPQIIYYVYSYLKMVDNGEISSGEKLSFSVPTGNFGNILAGYYAKKMGLPIDKLICASNQNRVLTDFFESGEYDRNREFVRTSSPSMDILISSNLERFLFDISGGNGEKVSKWYNDLNESGVFKIDADTKKEMDDLIVSGYADEDKVFKTISDVYKENNYVIDTHTAVAVAIAKEVELDSKIVIDSTASPYKFSNDVVKGLEGKEYSDEFDAVERISEISKTSVHRAVDGINRVEIKHKSVIEKDGMIDYVRGIIGK